MNIFKVSFLSIYLLDTGENAIIRVNKFVTTFPLGETEFI